MAFAGGAETASRYRDDPGLVKELEGKVHGRESPGYDPGEYIVRAPGFFIFE